MKLLLDTCAFLWFLADSPELSPAARSHIMDPANDVYLSAVSAWEIARKYAQGGLSLPLHPSALIPAVRRDSGIESLFCGGFAKMGAERIEARSERWRSGRDAGMASVGEGAVDRAR